MESLIRRWSAWLTMVGCVLSLMACGATPGLPGGSITATPSPSPEIMSGDQSSTAVPPDQPGPSAVPDEPQGPTEAPQGIYGCLVGKWQADSDSLAAYMQDAFARNADGKVDFQVSHTGGNLFLTFADDGTMTMASDSAQFDVSVANLAKVTVTVEAEGTASYADDGSYIAVWNQDYASSASGQGQVLSLPEVSSNAVVTITPDQLFAYAESSGFSISLPGLPASAHVAPYTCQGDTLVTGPPQFRPISWTRTQ